MPFFIESLPVHSSFIRRISLVYIDKEIHVTMAGRRTYVYPVPETSYWYNFKNAASKGRYYNKVIKRRFDYQRKY